MCKSALQFHTAVPTASLHDPTFACVLTKRVTQMASVTQPSEPYTEFRAIGVCTQAATVKLVRSIRTEAYTCQEGQKNPREQ